MEELVFVDDIRENTSLQEDREMWTILVTERFKSFMGFRLVYYEKYFSS